jgi:hypothetical protein
MVLASSGPASSDNLATSYLSCTFNPASNLAPDITSILEPEFTFFWCSGECQGGATSAGVQDYAVHVTPKDGFFYSPDEGQLYPCNATNLADCLPETRVSDTYHFSQYDWQAGDFVDGIYDLEVKGVLDENAKYPR